MHRLLSFTVSQEEYRRIHISLSLNPRSRHLFPKKLFMLYYIILSLVISSKHLHKYLFFEHQQLPSREDIARKKPEGGNSIVPYGCLRQYPKNLYEIL